MCRTLTIAVAAIVTVVVTAQCPAVPAGTCELCGPDQCVQDPAATVEILGFNCGIFEGSVLAGEAPFGVPCAFLQAVMGPCACGGGDGVTPTPPPPLPPVTQCPEVPTNACEICGRGRCVLNPNAMLELFDLDCGTAEREILIDPTQDDEFCGFIEDLTGACGCGIPPGGGAPTDAPVASCPEVPAGVCEICGAGLCVQDPSAQLGDFPVSCGVAEQDVLSGELDSIPCAVLQAAANGACSCGDGVTTLPPVAPAVAPTPAPVAPTGDGSSCPQLPAGACEICGPGLCVQNPDSPLGDFSITCGEAEVQIINGQIPPFISCENDIQANNGGCGCGTPAVSPTDAPVAPTNTPVAPTIAPVALTNAPVAPTNAPVAPPTDAPVAPTNAPVAPPTDAPVAPTDAPVAPTDAPVAVTPPTIFIEGQEGPSTSHFSLVIAAPTNRVVEPSLFDNAIIDLAQFGTALNIKFEPSNANVVRVNFSRDNVPVRSEGVAPYAIAGDNPPGNYFSWTPESGTTYEIEVEGLDSSGAVVETSSITISFCSACSPTPAPVAPPPPSPFIEGLAGPSTSQFVLVIASTNRELAPSLFDNAIIDLALFGSALNIKFEPSNADVVRVNFWQDNVLVRSEGVAPYAIAGDNPPGNYFSWNPESGATYEIEVEGLNPNNDVVETRSITVSFCSGCSGCVGVCENRFMPGAAVETSNFELVDANTDIIFSPPLSDNAVVDKAVFGNSLSITFNPSASSVGSVQFTESSTTNPDASRIENVAPYALRGDVSSDYIAWNPAVDQYVITAEAFESAGANGQSLESQQINLAICDGCYASCCPSI